ncbi:MAG: group III truncated hemoglobin [Burkholderiaceae bacterium]|nr:group III truncated hemoglobin [Burkholderiaceae bacterium]
MSATDLCTDAEIAAMVHAFYAKVRLDPTLGPIFNGHIDDWDRHLARLVDFWSSILRRTGRFTGAPMPKHIALPGLTAALFEHWLALFKETALSQPNRAMGETAYAMAQRIAQSLWFGYQMSRQPGAVPTTLAQGASAPH